MPLSRRALHSVLGEVAGCIAHRILAEGEQTRRRRIAAIARYGRSLALLAICIAASGCAAFTPREAFTFRKTREHPDPSSVLTYSYDRRLTTASQVYFKDAYETAPSEAERRHVRNRILYELMAVVDDHYFFYTRSLRSGAIGKGIVTDTLGVATSLAATAAGGEQIKTILSAISTGAQGVSHSIDANVLLGSTLEAIRLQMDAVRANIATDMIAKMRDQGTGGYPLEAGLRDIIGYYDAGTLTNGLAALSKEAGKQKSESQTKEAKAAKGVATEPER